MCFLLQGRYPSFDGPRSPDREAMRGGPLSRTGSLKGRELRRQYSMSEMGNRGERPRTPEDRDFDGRGRPKERGRPPGERGMSLSRGEMRERERERDMMYERERFDPHMPPEMMRGDPRGVNPRGDPRAGDPRGGDPRGGDPRFMEPRLMRRASMEDGRTDIPQGERHRDMRDAREPRMETIGGDMRGPPGRMPPGMPDDRFMGPDGMRKEDMRRREELKHRYVT